MTEATLESASSWDYYSQVEARAYLGDVSSDATEGQRYTTADIQLAHDSTVAMFEDFCGVAFVTRNTDVRIEGRGSRELFLPFRKVQGVSRVKVDERGGAGPVNYTGTLYTIEDNYIVGSSAFPLGSAVSMCVCHGHPTLFSDVKRAALVHLKDQIFGTGRVGDTNVPARARSYNTGSTTVELQMPTPDKPTGIPFVDSVLNRRKLAVLDLEGSDLPGGTFIGF